MKQIFFYKILECEAFFNICDSNYLFICPESTKHIMAITNTEQDSETIAVLNTALNTLKETIASDQMKSRQLEDEIETESKLSVYNFNN